MQTPQNNTPFEETAFKWLRSLDINISKDFITRELQTHADYPSVVALIDFLDMGGMKYSALESERKHIPQFNYPLLAHVKEDEKDYMVQVNTLADWDRNETLAKNWSGIVLFPDENARWHNEENTRQLKQGRAFNIFLTIVVLLVLSATVYLFRHQLYTVNIAWPLLSLTGLALSIATVATELGLQIKVVSEVCNSISPQGCNAVLKSKYAKGIAGVSVAGMALAYFSAQFLLLVLSSWRPGLLYTIQAIAIPLIMVAGTSLYTQKFVLKKWCALCLGIVAVLMVQGLLALVNFTAVYQGLAPLSVGYFFAIQFVLCALLLPVKDIIKNIQEQLTSAKELQKWKRDSALFVTQWQQTPAVYTDAWKDELQFGNRQAPLQITVACNPYCGPCAYAHETLHQLYHVYKNILHIKIRFTCSPGETDVRTTAVTAILRSAACLHNDDERAQMLADWFKWMDLEKWQRKWGTSAAIDVDELLKKHAAWMLVSHIKGTPTIFINGRQLPRKYILKDLFQLIPVLASSPVAMQENMV